MFSTTLPSLPHMMAHASSAGAPFDSEVSTADLDSEAFATTPSATPSTTTTTTEAMHLDMLTQLLDTSSNTSTTSTSTTSSTTASSISVSTSAWDGSPSISPMVLKLESPLLTSLDDLETTPEPTTRAGRKSMAASNSSSTSAINGRKRTAADSLDKETRARERVLRNRAAAQDSRDKKRKYVAEIEASNETLQHENSQLLKRLKTVESDNVSLSHRLEALTAQFAQMQQLLSQSVKHNQPGVGFCQSAVLAKKDKRSRHTDTLTNSPQQKLAPSKGNLHTTTSNLAPATKHRQVYSMTMKTLMSKKGNSNREARSSDQNAAQNRMEISCRSFCNNTSRNRTSTLSSSAAASFLTTRQSTRQSQVTVPNSVLMMMVLFTSTILPQLMLNFSTLFLISTGARSSSPQELQLQQAVLSFIRRQRLSSSRRLSNEGSFPPPHPALLLRSRTIKDNITSLHPSAIEEIVTEFRQGRRDVARGLLVKAFLSSRTTLDKDEGINKRREMMYFLLRKK